MSESLARHYLHLNSGIPASPDMVRAAFARAVKAAHPDSGGSGADIGRLKEARDYLLSRETMQQRSCAMCNGVGIVRKGFGSEPCSTCGGTGSIPC